MANSFKPLRVKDVGSDFDASELSQYAPADEEYIVYLAGYQVIASLGRVYPYRYIDEENGGNTISYPGTVGIDNNPLVGTADTIGSIVDNHTSSSLLTHPETSIVNVQTTTNVKVARNYAFDDADDFLSSGNGTYLNHTMFRWPCVWDEDVEGFRFINTTEIQEIGHRMLGYLESNTLPGSLYLGVTAPSDGDTWLKLVDSIHEDKMRGVFQVEVNGDYNLWVKTEMASPPTNSNNRPLFIATDKNIAGTDHDWQGGNILGLREMSDLQIGYTFGHFMASARGGFFNGNSNAVGSYVIRSGTQGAPTTPSGSTWVARGTVNDTRRIQADVDYARTNLLAFTGDGVANYQRTRQHALYYTGDYTRITDPATAFARSFTGNYARVFSRYFAGNFSGGPYIRATDNPVFYQRDRLGYFIRTSIPEFTRQEGFASGYSRAYLRASGSYTGNYTRTFLRYFVGTTPTFFGNYVSNFIGEYARPGYNRISTRLDVASYSRVFMRTSYQDFSDNTAFYQRVSIFPVPVFYIGDYTRVQSGFNFIGDFIGNYAGKTVTVDEEIVETYTLYVRTA